MPETIEPWQRRRARAAAATARSPRSRYRALRPYTRAELDATTFEAVVVEALNFPIPLVEVEPGIFALELFHGPTLAFKDVGARTMARLMASLDTGDQPLTVLAATSGDTGSAVAHAFHGVPHTRVVVLYPEGRVSPTQEAQLTMFNAEDGNVRAYAVAGSFDDCHRLTREAFANAELRQRVRLTSANSVNIGRLLPQMVYYFHARRRRRGTRSRRREIVDLHAERQLRQPDRGADRQAGRPADRAGSWRRPTSTTSCRSTSTPGASSRARRCRRSPTRWTSATRATSSACAGSTATTSTRCGATSSAAVISDDEVRATIKRVYDERGYLLDRMRPAHAIAYMGLSS